MSIATMERPMEAPDMAFLTAEVARLKRQLAGVPDQDTFAIAEWFGLNPAPAKIVVALTKANGRTLSAQKLIGAVGGRATKEAIQVHIHEARKALGIGAILTVKGEGYRLSASGLADCRGVMGR